MSRGISNFTIDKFFKEQNEEIQKNYMGTYSINSITRYINFYEIMKKRNAKYPFAIFNTDKENKPGKHWWSFLDIQPKNNLFLFDSLGLDGFKIFIVNNDERVINELLFNFKRCESQGKDKLKLCSMKFCPETWQKLPQKVRSQLTETAQNFFHLLEQFAKLKKTRCMNIIILENKIQNLLSGDCGPFQFYFYRNLFDPFEKSAIIEHKTWNKKTLETILNEIFFTEINENQYVVKKFEENYNLKTIFFILEKKNIKLKK